MTYIIHRDRQTHNGLNQGVDRGAGERVPQQITQYGVEWGEGGLRRDALLLLEVDLVGSRRGLCFLLIQTLELGGEGH